jgi:type II restriction/modification system DNA methylase subunit YeeA
MQSDWFGKDASNRFVEFIRVAWSPKTLTENLSFVAESLGVKSNETPIDTIRRYLSTDFFKDHLKTYRKRPIYWLFSSGKEKAFEALVYLHRYNEGTLSRMRMEYVIPLQGRISSRIDRIGRDIDAAATTAVQKKLRKQEEKLKRQQAELIKFDEELRHYADMRIRLDLDDGVRINYGKFGNLLAEVKAITGDSDE